MTDKKVVLKSFLRGQPKWGWAGGVTLLWKFSYKISFFLQVMASSRRMSSCDLIFVHRNELTCQIFKVFGTIGKRRWKLTDKKIYLTTYMNIYLDKIWYAQHLLQDKTSINSRRPERTSASGTGQSQPGNNSSWFLDSEWSKASIWKKFRKWVWGSLVLLLCGWNNLWIEVTLIIWFVDSKWSNSSVVWRLNAKFVTF